MSETPGIIQRVNYVTKMWQNTCGAPWTIYFETAGPAALEAFMLLLGTNMSQVVRGYARPRRALHAPPTGRGRGQRGAAHGSGRQRGRGPAGATGRSRLARLQIGRWLAPDIGTEIGKRLPGAQLLSARKIDTTTRHLWIIDTQIQRLLWYWLLVEAGTLFAYQWTSAIYESIECQNSLDSFIVRRGENLVLSIPPPSLRAVSGGPTQKINNATTQLSVGHTLAMGPGSNTFGVEHWHPQGQSYTVQFGLQLHHPDGIQTIMGEPQQNPGGQTQETIIQATSQAGRQVGYVAIWSRGGIRYNSTVFGQASAI